MDKCYDCGFWNFDYETCTCLSSHKWYACPIENKKPENIKELEEYVKWLSKYDNSCEEWEEKNE